MRSASAPLIDKHDVALGAEVPKILLPRRTDRLRCDAAWTAFEPEHRIRRATWTRRGGDNDAERDPAARPRRSILVDLECTASACRPGRVDVARVQIDRGARRAGETSPGNDQ